MPTPDPLAPAFDALTDCAAALEALDARCCEPGRSPRMRSLGATLTFASEALATIGRHPDAASQTLAYLEDAGGQVGRLQIGCCAPNRLPLYARILEGLTTAQLTVSRAAGTGH